MVRKNTTEKTEKPTAKITEKAVKKEKKKVGSENNAKDAKRMNSNTLKVKFSGTEDLDASV